MQKKKRLSSRLLSLLLIAALALAFPASALATEASENVSLSMVAGESSKNYTVDSLSGVTGLTLESQSGDIFTLGMTAMVSATSVVLSGNIATPGTYTGTVVANWLNGSDPTRCTYAITITVSAPSTPTPTASPTPTPSASPTATPSPTPTASPSPTPGKPVVTKNPTGETVEVGGSALFIARADNSTEIVWRFISADGSKTVYYTSAASYFPGLQVSGGNTETLTLSRIPYELNGWKAACLFKNAAGETLSAGARITVNKAAATPTPTAMPTATPSPTPKTSPTPTPTPTHTHSYGGDWKYDEDAHWHECSCGERGDLAAHNIEWTVTKEATRKEEGERQGKCIVCGFERSETVPVLTKEEAAANSGPSFGLILFLVFAVAAVAVGGTLLLLKFTGHLGGRADDGGDDEPKPRRRKKRR